MADNHLSAQILRATLAYDPDTGIFTKERQSKPCGRLTTKGYRQISVCGARYMAHRLAWLYVHGDWPIDQLDHINQHKDDNRIVNLRLVSNKQNQENITSWSHNTSGRRGVRWHRRLGMWVAELVQHKAKLHLGTFDNMLDAVAARMRGERTIYTHATDYT